MENKYYSCDTGSVSVLCGNSLIKFCNNIGDGCYRVYHFESNKEYEEYQKKFGIKTSYVAWCEFQNAKVLEYDCNRNSDVLWVLNGTYLIECKRNSGEMYFVKINEDNLKHYYISAIAYDYNDIINGNGYSKTFTDYDEAKKFYDDIKTREDLEYLPFSLSQLESDKYYGYVSLNDEEVTLEEKYIGKEETNNDL